MPKTILLDVDGTLIDSNDAHAQAWVKAFEEAGIEIPYSAVRRKIGMGADQLLPRLTGIASTDPEGLRLSKRQGEIYLKEFMPSLKVFGGARELLLRLTREGFKLVIATSGDKDILQRVLAQVGLDGMRIPIVTPSHGKASKPEADLVEAALRQVGGRPEDAFMIGDTPYDIAAAEKAGVPTIAFCCGGWTLSDLQGAAAVYEDARDFLKNFERSPLGKAPEQAAS